MECPDLVSARPDFSSYYRNEWWLSNRQWRMRGIRFVDMPKGRVDMRWAADTVISDARAHLEAKRENAAAAKVHMPSRDTATLLLFSQVRALRVLVRSGMITAHHEAIYDALTLKALKFHHYVLKENGDPRPIFLDNPVAHLQTACKTVVRNIMYDLFRYQIETRKGVHSTYERHINRTCRAELVTSVYGSRMLQSAMDYARSAGISLESVLTGCGGDDLMICGPN